MPLKILSINVRGLGLPRKSDLLIHELRKLNYDLILLQETHVNNESRAKLFEPNWHGQCLWSFGTGKSVGFLPFPLFLAKFQSLFSIRMGEF